MEAMNYFYGYLTDKKLPNLISKDFGQTEPSGIYTQSTDTIVVNRTLEGRWALYTIAHELMHSSGHKDRLNRFTMTNYNDPYNNHLEEIVADTGAYIISCVVGGQDIILDYAYKSVVTKEIEALKKLGVSPLSMINFGDIYEGVGYWLRKSYKGHFFNAKSYLLEFSK